MLMVETAEYTRKCKENICEQENRVRGSKMNAPYLKIDRQMYFKLAEFYIPTNTLLYTIKY